MKSRGATFFTKTILLVLLTIAHPSLQDSNYYPNAFSNWNDLRSCAQGCLGIQLEYSSLGCSVNDCYCRADIVPQAVSIVSACVSSSCSNTNDVVSATSFYEAYCASVTDSPVISLITPAPVAGSSVTGTLISTITTTLQNGQTTVVGSVIYQYGNNDNVGNNNGNNNGNGNNDNNGSGNSQSSKSSAVQQVVIFLRSAKGWDWALYMWTAVVIVAVAGILC